MQDSARSALGFGVLGFAVGLFVHPFLFVVTVRQKIAEPRDTTWAIIFYALILLPALLFALYGWNKGRAVHQP